MKAYFDTSILYKYCLWRYFDDKSTDREVINLFMRGLKGDYEIVLSSISFDELSTLLLRKRASKKFLKFIINELCDSEELSYVTQEMITDEFLESVKLFTELGMAKEDSIHIQMAIDCGCTEFITEDEQILSINNILKEKEVLSQGFYILDPQEFKEILDKNFEINKMLSSDKLFENYVTDYYLAEGYTSATILDKDVTDIDILLNREGYNIAIDTKFYADSETSASQVLRHLENLNKKPFNKVVIVSSTGFTEEARRIADDNRDKIELVQLSELLENVPNQELITIQHDVEKEKLPSIKKPKKLISLWEDVKNADTNDEKGKALEKWSVEMFSLIDGIKVEDIKIRTDSEEIDIMLSNEKTSSFWVNLGDPILVECKNWKNKVGVPEISNFFLKLLRRQLKVGIFITVNGFTGDEYRNAIGTIQDLRTLGYRIIVMEEQDILDINSCTHPTDKIRERYYALFKS